jgi:hypothetical protein
MNDMDKEEALASLDALVHQAEELIRQFDITITGAPAPNYGSNRYQKAAYALDRLTRAEVQLRDSHRHEVWEQTTVDGRNGEYLVSQITPLKQILQRTGEGAPQPKP